MPNTRILLTNGAQACNVFWQVGSSATISTATQFVGTILADQSVTVNTGATLETGRVLARNGAVTLDTNVIRRATCATPPSGGTTPPPGGGTTPPPATTPPGDVGSPVPGDTGSATPVGSSPTSTTTTATTPTATTAGGARRPGGSAQLSGPRRPVSGPFTAVVTGHHIASVHFYVDGRPVATVGRRRPGQTLFTARIRPPSNGHHVHRLTATITYTTLSRTPSTKLRVPFRGPTVAPRPPRFTG